MTAYSTTQNGLTSAQTSFTQRITLHLSEEKQAKNKMQKHKDILVAVPKSIYNNLLYGIAIGQTVQSSSKAPST
jgi:hypothetical protein